MKKMIIIVVVVLLLASLIQVALADPPGPVPASCNMGNSWWDPDAGNSGPGNANGVKDGQRGMYHVHNKDNPNGYTHGAANMDIICPG